MGHEWSPAGRLLRNVTLGMDIHSQSESDWSSIVQVMAVDCGIICTAVLTFLCHKGWLSRGGYDNIRETRRCALRSWRDITAFFSIPLSTFREHCGPGVHMYLSFEIQLIWLLVVLSLFDLGVILPINIWGAKRAHKDYTSLSFDLTTASSIAPESDTLWAHVLTTYCTAALVFYVFATYGERSSSRSVGGVRQEARNALEARTVFVSQGIPPNVDRDAISSGLRGWFGRASRANKQLELTPQSLTAARPVMDLTMLLDIQRRKEALQTASERSRMLRDAPESVPVCVRTCPICRPDDALEARAAAELQEMRLDQAQLLRRGFRGTGTAFLTFRCISDAEAFLTHFKDLAAHDADGALSASSWVVKAAPKTSDVNWLNLNVPPRRRWAILLLVNLLLVAMLFFITTPTAVLSTLKDKAHVDLAQSWQKAVAGMTQTGNDLGGGAHEYNSFVVAFMPGMMVLFLNSILLQLVYVIGRYLEPYITFSSAEKSIMRNSFAFLLLNSLLLPALSLSSISALYVSMRKKQRECGVHGYAGAGHSQAAAAAHEALEDDPALQLKRHFECQSLLFGQVFLQGTGSYFFIYCFHRACLTNAISLWRLPERLYFLIRRSSAVTPAEVRASKVNWPFEAGQNYALLLESFSICVCFSTIVPVIVPVGVLFLLFKHWIDRYNLLYVWRAEVRSSTPVRVQAQWLMLPILLLYEVLMCGFIGLRGTADQFTAVSLLPLLSLGAIAYWSSAAGGKHRRLVDGAEQIALTNQVEEARAAEAAALRNRRAGVGPQDSPGGWSDTGVARTYEDPVLHQVRQDLDNLRAVGVGRPSGPGAAGRRPGDGDGGDADGEGDRPDHASDSGASASFTPVGNRDRRFDGVSISV